jgi:hypothetical protein
MYKLMSKSNLHWTEKDLLDARQRINRTQQVGSANEIINPKQSPIQGRARQHKRHIAGIPNKTEQRFIDEWLKAKMIEGEIVDWWFESVTLKLAADCRYTPDFMTQDTQGYISFYEVKGTTKNKSGKQVPFSMDDSAVKTKVSPHHFPFNFYVAHPVKEGWNIIPK